jgi:homoserine kinase
MLALALQLQSEVQVEAADGVLSIDPGEGAGAELHDPHRNLVTWSYARAAQSLGVEPSGARFRCVNSIPFARGLGSSAAAALSGVLAAVALHQAPWHEHDVIDLVARIEGHRDNAAAAMLGGLVICAPGVPAARMDVPEELHAVLFLPDAHLPTTAARDVVPGTFSRDDAVFNASRCALLVRAMALRDFASLGAAMEDRWHQPARMALAPATTALIGAARGAGAAGAALSGAGPSVLALTVTDPAPVAAAMEQVARSLAVPGTSLVLRPRNFGARVDVKP